VAWFAYLGLSTTEMGPDILLLIASIHRGRRPRHGNLLGSRHEVPHSETAIVPIGGFVAAQFF
jgi:hypothetical protein